MTTRHTTITKGALCALLALLTTACGADEGGGPNGIPVSGSGGGGEGGAYADSGGNNTAGEGPDGEGVAPEAGQLTAGRWRDVDDWGMWVKLMDPSAGSWRDMVTAWGYLPLEVVSVEVTSAGAPAIDATVTLEDAQGEALWTARTDYAGRAYLFPAFFTGAPAGQGLQVTAGGVSAPATLDATVELDAPALAAPPEVLDVMFMIDVTGSMLDEQAYLRSEMRDVISRLEAARPDLELRASTSFYCDPAEFSVDAQPFGTVASALDVLDVGASCGGGDYPEAVDEALDAALGLEWSPSARARVLFLVLDAPPHQDQEGTSRLARFAREASERGIKLVPIVSSGANKPLEFMLRPLVMATNGTYTFLTSDSGIGDDKIEPTIGSFEVEYLNELMLDYLLTQTL
jgi:hypothetical protein